MSLSGLIKKVASAAAKAAKKYSSGSSSNHSSSGSSGKRNNNSTSSGYFDKNKDYAAAIRSANDTAEKAKLVAERQNKLDYMNNSGQNKNGYSNSIYNNTSFGLAGGSNNNNKSGSGYFDTNKDYAAAIRNTRDATEKAKLVSERQNKINWMNETGQNKNGYSNSIYNNQKASSFGNNSAFGNTSSLDMSKLQKGAKDREIQNALAAMEKNSQLYSTATAQDQMKLITENQGYEDQLKKLGVAPFQKDGRYYYKRLDDQTNETEGTYSGDSSLSLPDLALLRQYQTAYNISKANGDSTGMQAAHQMAEKLRDNYRYYPTKNSNGYGLGQNDIGFIRDMTVRVDDLGNRYVDQYNKNTVTTNVYDANGRLVNTHTSGNIDAHNARVAEQIDRTNSILAAQGKENNTYALRVSDPNDLSLSNDALRAQYGLSGGLMNYSDEYYTPQAVENNMGYGAPQVTPEIYDPPQVAPESFDSYAREYNDIADYLERSRNAQLQQMLGQLEQQKSLNNMSFDDIARQAFIANRQSQMNLPQQLAALGISGGGSETAQLGLTTNYQNNLNSNELARQQMIQQIANGELQAKLQADSDINGYYANSQQSALAAYQQQQAQQQAYNQWLQQFNYQQQQDSLNREWQQLQYNNNLKQYQDSLKQNELQLALQLGDYNKLKAAGYDTTALMQAVNGWGR